MKGGRRVEGGKRQKGEGEIRMGAEKIRKGTAQ